MLPTTTPYYDYEKNAGRKVIIRFVQSILHYSNRRTYYLQFRTEGCMLLNHWHLVREYIPTASSSDCPGIPGKMCGNWYPRGFLIDSEKAGNEMLAELKENISTVEDIFKCFIMPGIALMKKDMKTYEMTQNAYQSLPKIFI